MRRGVHRCVKHLTGIVLCLLVSLCCNIAVYACSFQSGIMTAIDYNCHVLTGGVTGRYFYKDSSTSIYNTIIC